MLFYRLSKIAGNNIRYGNPNVADLSDPLRPTEIGKMFAEVYDNEWTDAFEEVNGDEAVKIQVLNDIVMVIIFYTIVLKTTCRCLHRLNVD